MDLWLVYNVVGISRGHSEEQITEPFRAALSTQSTLQSKQVNATKAATRNTSMEMRTEGTRGSTLIQVISLTWGGSLSPHKSNKKGSSWDSHETFIRMFVLCKRTGNQPTHDRTTPATSLKSNTQQTVLKVYNTISLLITHRAYNHLAFTPDSACMLVRWFKCHLVSDNMSEVHIRCATHAYLWWRKVCCWHAALNYARKNLNIKANMSNTDCNFYIGLGGGSFTAHFVYISIGLWSQF